MNLPLPFSLPLFLSTGAKTGRSVSYHKHSTHVCSKTLPIYMCYVRCVHCVVLLVGCNRTPPQSELSLIMFQNSQEDCTTLVSESLLPSLSQMYNYTYCTNAIVNQSVEGSRPLSSLLTLTLHVSTTQIVWYLSMLYSHSSHTYPGVSRY